MPVKANQLVTPLMYARNQGGGVGLKAAVSQFSLGLNIPQTYQYDVVEDLGLDLVGSVFVDNGNNAGHLSIYFLGSMWTLRVGPATQGIFPVLSPPGLIGITIQSTAIVSNVTLHWLNQELLIGSWPS